MYIIGQQTSEYLYYWLPRLTLFQPDRENIIKAIYTFNKCFQIYHIWRPCLIPCIGVPGVVSLCFRTVHYILLYLLVYWLYCGMCRCFSLFLRPVRVYLYSATIFCSICHFSWFYIISCLAEGTLCSFIQVTWRYGMASDLVYTPGSPLLAAGLQINFMPLIQIPWACPGNPPFCLLA